MIDLKNKAKNQVVERLERYYLGEYEPRIELCTAAGVGRSRGDRGEVSSPIVVDAVCRIVICDIGALYGHYSRFLSYYLFRAVIA